MEKNAICRSGQETFQYSGLYENPGSDVAMGKNITQMSFDELQAHFFASGEEFSSKMQENFKCYVFISASSGTQNLDEVLKNMAIFAGYQMHKAVGCSQRIYHLYVKYETETIAVAARDYFRMKDLYAEVVYDMLHLWYAFEKASGLPRCQTVGWLTVSDNTYNTSQSADQVLGNYGNLDMNAVMDRPVKICYNSLAEAFAACISLGPWYHNDIAYSKYYSVKIELSEHCSRIMRMCNMTCVASDFDYFVQNDSVVDTKVNDSRPLQLNEVELDQQNRNHQGRNARRPNWSGQRSRNCRVFKRT